VYICAHTVRLMEYPPGFEPGPSSFVAKRLNPLDHGYKTLAGFEPNRWNQNSLLCQIELSPYWVASGS
jgi:hypothetical protein